MKTALLIAFFCAFLLVAPAQAQESTGGKVYWYGSVDNKVHLVIRGLTLEQRTVEGNATEPGRYSFTAPLPQAGVTVAVNKMEGRNKVTVVQQPSAGNNFTAIVEIHDDDGGARDYLLEISWQ